MPSNDERADLDELIADITVDAYGDEGYWSFLQAFEDRIRFPVNATLVGIHVTVTAVDFDGNERRGLTADVTRDGQSSIVSILDLELPDSQAEVKRLISAYRRWLGIT
jgi:hypothetical protein